MKRIAMVLAVIWLLSLPLTAFAAAYEVTAVPGGKSVEVYGIRKSSKSYYEIVIGADGIDTVTLPSGVTVSGKSDSAEDVGLRVIIIPVTADEEAAAYAWMTDAAKDIGKDPTAYYLAFYRENNTPAQPQGKVTITVTQRGAVDLYYMDGDAKKAVLSHTAAADTVTVTVWDTGCGMDAETLPRIFEQFYQGETDRRADGCGLGLTLCKRIVEQHGGTISAESRPGEGSRFSVVLPAKAAKFM